MQRRQDGKRAKKQKTSMSDKQRTEKKYPRLYPACALFFAVTHRRLNCAHGDFLKNTSHWSSKKGKMAIADVF